MHHGRTYENGVYKLLFCSAKCELKPAGGVVTGGEMQTDRPCAKFSLDLQLKAKGWVHNIRFQNRGVAEVEVQMGQDFDTLVCCTVTRRRTDGEVVASPKRIRGLFDVKEDNFVHGEVNIAPVPPPSPPSVVRIIFRQPFEPCTMLGIADLGLLVRPSPPSSPISSDDLPPVHRFMTTLAPKSDSPGMKIATARPVSPKKGSAPAAPAPPPPSHTHTHTTHTHPAHASHSHSHSHSTHRDRDRSSSPSPGGRRGDADRDSHRPAGGGGGGGGYSPRGSPKGSPRPSASPTPHRTASTPEGSGDESGPLDGVVFVLSGYQNEKREKLKQMICGMGGKYVGDVGPGVTHVVSIGISTPKAQKALEQGGIKVVSPEWVRECKRTWMRIPDIKYLCT